jgi:hypothetical protein
MMSSELTAAVVSGWAVAWALRMMGVPPFGAFVVGLLVWCTVFGTYRRRYATPPNLI